ncbi:MAG: DUF3160 domain-containing protein, partial [Candidatus Thorarchaeota archaeon]
SEEVELKIQENYISAVQSYNYIQFSDVYDDNYWESIPSFITVDAMYHTFHVLYDYALRTIELDNFTMYLDVFCTHMVEACLTQYDTLENSLWKECARYNTAFFSVAKKCLSPDWVVPEQVVDIVTETLNLVNLAEGFNRDWFMDQMEDFSQYKPRGHYTRTSELERFFKAMMWLGRINFRLYPADDWLSETENDKKGLDETAQAILIVEAMLTSSSVLRASDVFMLWDTIYLPTAFFVGESDDLTPREYNQIVEDVYGVEHSLSDIQNESKLEVFREAANQLRNPRILSDFMLDRETMEIVTKGMSVFGQRFIPDSYILWNLVHPNVVVRNLPKGLDVMCALGSVKAFELLENETLYVNYTQQMERLQNEFGNTTRNQWIQNLYWLWLYSLKPMLSIPSDGYPSFMLSEAWQEKSLCTALGTWTELRHDTILYAKQSYTGTYSTPPPQQGYVEPVPEVYSRLASLCKMMVEGLEGRSLINDEIGEKLRSLHRALLRLKVISEKELSNTPLNQTENEFMQGIGFILRGLERTSDRDVDRAALITDVHTDTNTNLVLEEATGDPMVIFVAVPNPDGSVYLTRGAMYSYYEFAVDMSDRMTDEEWWEMLDSESEPTMPSWVFSFVADTSQPSLGIVSTILDTSFSDICAIATIPRYFSTT